LNPLSLKYLEDIKTAILDLEMVLGDDISFEKFSNDFSLKRTAERQFEIMGEALRKLKNIENELNISFSREIIGLRNIIAHSYDAVDYAMLYSIIIRHLPLLKKEVSDLIDSV
jgi:uncharacterized protein with HEPN domain